MPKAKACKLCNKIFEGEKCPSCESREFTEAFKGRIVIMNPEKSEIAKKLNLQKKGNFALKTK